MVVSLTEDDVKSCGHDQADGGHGDDDPGPSCENDQSDGGADDETRPGRPRCGERRRDETSSRTCSRSGERRDPKSRDPTRRTLHAGERERGGEDGSDVF